MQRKGIQHLHRSLLLGVCVIGFSLLASSGSQPAASGDVPKGLSRADWNSIRAEYERNRRFIFRADDEFRARNPQQQWLARFDGRGFLLDPDKAQWRWGLELGSYGFAGHQREVKSPARVTADKERLTYSWDEILEEWFVNDQQGLEHGFTLRERPAGDGDRLSISIEVRGDLRPEALPDGSGVSFADWQGHSIMQYAGLKVWDANGTGLPAHLESDAAGSG